jgi:hypothetical protein
MAGVARLEPNRNASFPRMQIHLTMPDAVPHQVSLRLRHAGRQTHNTMKSATRVTMRIVPSKEIMNAIWKFGFLNTLSFLPILFNVREY